MQKKLSKYALAVRSVTLFLSAFTLGVALLYSQPFLAFADSPIAISFDAERFIYSVGEPVTISGWVKDYTQEREGVPAGVMSTVDIQITRLSDGKVIYQVSTPSYGDGSFFDRGFRPPYEDEFEVRAIATVLEKDTTVNAMLIIKVQPAFSLTNLFSDPFMTLSLATPIGIVLLLSLSIWPVERYDEEEEKRRWLKFIRISHSGFYVWQFLLLSVITASPILALTFFPRQIGSDAPIGLVVSDRMWVFNIGGTSSGLSYEGGITIPVYVAILGLLGAYLAYLRKVPSLIKAVEKESHEPKETFRPLATSMETLAYFLLGPILAVGLWLGLLQLGTNPDPPYTLAIASLTVGLLTERVTDFLISLGEKVLKTRETSGEEKGSVNQ